MSEPCRFDPDERPYACLTHNTQWLDDKADQCEYKRMIVAEVQLKAVRRECYRWTQSEDSNLDGAAKAILSILNGGNY